MFKLKIKYIINEEILRFLKESDLDDVIYDYFNNKEEKKIKIFNDFLHNNNSNYTKNIPWRVVPFPRLKKIWEDFIKYGFVRDEKGINLIEGIVINNIMKIDIITELLGHTPNDPSEDYDDNIGEYLENYLKCREVMLIDKDQLEIDFDGDKGYKKKDLSGYGNCNHYKNEYLDKLIEENNLSGLEEKQIKDFLYDDLAYKFSEYYAEDPKSGQPYISDFALNPLLEHADQLYREQKSERKLVIIDKILNIVHPRSDIASWFVEGGSQALSQLSGYDEKEFA